MRKRILLLAALSVVLLIPQIAMAQINEDDYQLRFKKDSFKNHTKEGTIDVTGEFIDWPHDNNGNIAACVCIKIENMAVEDAKRLTAKISSGTAQLVKQEFKENLMELWLWVSPKTFSIEIYGDGYKSRPYQINRKLESRKFYDLILEYAKRTTITFDIQPQGVVAYVDGVIVDKENKIDVYNGSHKVKFSKNGIDMQTDTVIMVSSQNYFFKFDLREKYTVTVKSKPSKADVIVRVDEKDLLFGQTPTNINLPEGTYRMIVSQQGLADTSLLNVSQGIGEVTIELEKKKKIEFYAVYDGKHTKSNIYINRIDKESRPITSENKAENFEYTLSYGRYKVAMSNGISKKERKISINSKSPNIFRFKIPTKGGWVWPWEREFESKVFGISVGYAQHSYSLKYDNGYLSADPAWFDFDKATSAIQTGIHFQPAFNWGGGIYTGVFYDVSFSKTPSTTKAEDENSSLKDTYTNYTEHELIVPVHLYFRIPFSETIALSLHGGIDGKIGLVTTYKDKDKVFMDYKPSYGEYFMHKRFDFGYSLCAGFQWEWALVEFWWHKGIMNMEIMSEEEPNLEKSTRDYWSIKFSYLF